MIWTLWNLTISLTDISNKHKTIQSAWSSHLKSCVFAKPQILHTTHFIKINRKLPRTNTNHINVSPCNGCMHLCINWARLYDTKHDKTSTWSRVTLIHRAFTLVILISSPRSDLPKGGLRSQSQILIAEVRRIKWVESLMGWGWSATMLAALIGKWGAKHT